MVVADLGMGSTETICGMGWGLQLCHGVWAPVSPLVLIYIVVTTN